ncbi:hypothetical protein OSB04_018073 [Centaurea solstitialis]|uniref:Uncharacterized protein n=1 Tax=Centaurea solstitialis TaxID=347529 RepID=A0AA38TBP0_9ASTR|nr:hypothetical protein OSB04_018073 [Centaurea solstitialis]
MVMLSPMKIVRRYTKTLSKMGSGSIMSSTSSRSTKRTRTFVSSDAHFGGPNKNDDEEDFHVEEEIAQPQRPIGRNKAKKAFKSNRSDTPVIVPVELALFFEYLGN